jgi:hypothetical protein
MRIRIVLGLFFSLFYASLVVAESGYVQARQAELFAEPALKSVLVAVAKKGDAVVIEQRQGRWLKVKLGDKSGWVSTLLVGSEPPKEKITVLDAGDQALEQTARRRASATAAAAAARGLRGEERARQSDGNAVDFNALQQMEAAGVPEDEALQFQQQESEK